MNKEENTYYKNSPKFGRKGPSKIDQNTGNNYQEIGHSTVKLLS